MGFTGLARWVNAPSNGLDFVQQNIVHNHAGTNRGRWFLSVRSYRSVFSSIRGLQIAADRSMCALTMNNSVFVLIEDPAAPTRADFLAVQAQAQQVQPQTITNSANPEGTSGHSISDLPPSQIIEPPHYRNTFLTVGPPNALEQLLAQLRARWLSTRQSSSTTQRPQSQNTGQQLVIDGYLFSIGTDWLVRVGNVVLAGGAAKGMLLEAEYLPLPVIHPQNPDETPELLSNLLMSILPNVPNARTVAVTISDAQWEEVLWNQSEPEEEELAKASAKDRTDGDKATDDDDIFVYEDEQDGVENTQKGDWVGVERDRRSAFLIIGALKSEGIL